MLKKPFLYILSVVCDFASGTLNTFSKFQENLFKKIITD